LSTEGRENGDLGAVAHYSGVPLNLQMSETRILMRLLRIILHGTGNSAWTFKTSEFRALGGTPLFYSVYTFKEIFPVTSEVFFETRYSLALRSDLLWNCCSRISEHATAAFSLSDMILVSLINGGVESWAI
jgi:hypothetical protein